MKYPRNLKVFTGQMEVAPFAGVFFLLVLFVVLESALAPPPGVHLRLPVGLGDGSPGTAGPTLVVTIDRDEQLYFEQQNLTAAALRARLAEKARAAREAPALLVEADKSVAWDAIVQLTTLARAAGIREVTFATRPPLFAPPARPGL